MDTLAESLTCEYVEVVLIVRHALHDVTHTPIAMIVIMIKICFIVIVF